MTTENKLKLSVLRNKSQQSYRPDVTTLSNEIYQDITGNSILHVINICLIVKSYIFTVLYYLFLLFIDLL